MPLLKAVPVGSHRFQIPAFEGRCFRQVLTLFPSLGELRLLSGFRLVGHGGGAGLSRVILRRRPLFALQAAGPTPCFFQLSATGDGTVVRMPFMPSSLSGCCFRTALSFPPPLSPLRLTLRQHRQPHPLSLRNHHGGWGKFAGSGDLGHPIHCHPFPEWGQSASGEFQIQAESRSGVHRPYGRRAGFLGPGGELRLGLGGQRWNVLGLRSKRDAGSPLSGPLKSV